MINSRPTPPARGAALIEALANDAPTEATMRALWTAARAWLATGGTMPLERFAQLPTTPGAVRNAARNLWIQRAAKLVAPDELTFPQAYRLYTELETFLVRGPWAEWRSAPTPPDSASELRKALFHIAKNNNGELLSQRHIARVIANK